MSSGMRHLATVDTATITSVGLEHPRRRGRPRRRRAPGHPSASYAASIPTRSSATLVAVSFDRSIR